MEITIQPENKKIRCEWCLSSDLYKKYHDQEWGKPVYDDKKFFELLILETFQAGLSWITILNKRENFKIAFDNFNYKLIANYKEDKIQRLMQNPGIIRNQLKIRATVSNATTFIKIQNEIGDFSTYIWNFIGNMPINNVIESHNDLVSKTTLSDKISNDLKKRGFKFVGSTVVYAYMQATGLVNDHLNNCFFKN